MSQSAAVYPKRLDHVIVNDDDEAPSILNPMTGQILVTNKVGQCIFELLDGENSVDDIVAHLVGRFEGAREEVVREDVEGFLNEGREKGLVE